MCRRVAKCTVLQCNAVSPPYATYKDCVLSCSVLKYAVARHAMMSNSGGAVIAIVGSVKVWGTAVCSRVWY